MKIRDWYMKAYPMDDLGASLNAGATFEGLFNTLDAHQDVYQYLGVGDSTIRERCFGKLAEIIDADYMYVYHQWLLGA